MGPITICVLVLTLLSIMLFSYVGWQVSQKRKAMQFITVAERKRFQTLTITAVAILFSAIIGLGTAVMG